MRTILCRISPISDEMLLKWKRRLQTEKRSMQIQQITAQIAVRMNYSIHMTTLALRLDII